MLREPATGARRRGDSPARLSRERIVTAAVAIADREGVGAVSMRRIGQDLGVDPMSLYRHVQGKDGLLDAMTDAVVAEIEPVVDAGRWQASARATMLAAREVMLRHPWTADVLKARSTPTPAALQHLDAFLGILRGGGLDVDLVHHAIHVLGSRILGFSQDLYDDKDNVRPDSEESAQQARVWAASLPRLAELAVSVSHGGALGGCDDDAEFAFAVDLILEGLERRRRAASRSRS
jgi:AcrR family transcriptional regulator